MITTNQYLELYPIKPDSQKLIVGTIHPHNHELFEVPFFYGNRNSIWKILSLAFPEEFTLPLDVKSITTFLDRHKISVSDTIKKCKRKNNTAFDKDLIPLELNTEIVSQIKNSQVTEIFFTSGFSTNNACKLFLINILGYKKIPEQLRKEKQMVIEDFGRPIKLNVLISPSGSSNIGLSKSKIYLENKHKYLDSPRPIYDFKIDYYRKIFNL